MSPSSRKRKSAEVAREKSNEMLNELGSHARPNLRKQGKPRGKLKSKSSAASEKKNSPTQDTSSSSLSSDSIQSPSPTKGGDGRKRRKSNSVSLNDSEEDDNPSPRACPTGPDKKHSGAPPNTKNNGGRKKPSKRTSSEKLVPGDKENVVAQVDFIDQAQRCTSKLLQPEVPPPAVAASSAKAKAKSPPKESAEWWRGKFEKLNQLRCTRQEKLLQDREHVFTQQLEAKDDLIAFWKNKADANKKQQEPEVSSEEVAAMQEELDELKVSLERAQSEEAALRHALARVRHNARSKGTAEEGWGEVDRQELLLLRRLSGVTVLHMEEGGEGGDTGSDGNTGRVRLVCMAASHRKARAVRFTLDLPGRGQDGEEEGGGGEADDDVSFMATGNAHLLPEYLQEEIEFSASDLPMFMSKLSDALQR